MNSTDKESNTVNEDQFQISEVTRQLTQATLNYISEQSEAEVNTNVDEFLNGDAIRVFLEVYTQLALRAVSVEDNEDNS